jgi:hypothetical protein
MRVLAPSRALGIHMSFCGKQAFWFENHLIAILAPNDETGHFNEGTALPFGYGALTFYVPIQLL